MTRLPFPDVDEDKRTLSHARTRYYGMASADRDLTLTQFKRCATFLKIKNPYPEPKVEADLPALKAEDAA